MSVSMADAATDGAGLDGRGPARQFVTFSAGRQVYGIDIVSVRDIRSWSSPTELPGGATGSRGVLDVRGHVVEVFDLAAILGRGPIEAGPGHVVLIVSGDDGDIGLVVEAVSDIVTLQDGGMSRPPNAGGDAGRTKVAGLIRREGQLIAVLDLAALLPGATGTWLLD